MLCPSVPVCPAYPYVPGDFWTHPALSGDFWTHSAHSALSGDFWTGPVLPGAISP